MATAATSAARPHRPRHRPGAGRGDVTASRYTVKMITPVVTRRLLRAKDLMDSEYARALKVDQIAQSAHLTTAHFSRQFRRAFGETPHQYLLSRRLERAAALLANTDYTVTRVCELVGLSSVGSFSTAFRRAYDASPTTYRARHLPALAHRVIPPCILLAVGRPQLSRIREDAAYPAHVR
jgi:AraC-like DNA-binding protein